MSQCVNSWAIAGFVKLAPPSVERAQAIASRCCWPWFALNSYCRQVTKTVPVRVTAMSHSWFPWTDSEIFCVVHVRPPSVDRPNSMKLFGPDAVKRAQQTYTFPANGLFSPSSASSSTLSSKCPIAKRGRRPAGHDRRELVVRGDERRVPVVSRDPDRTVGRLGAVERDPAVVQMVRAVPVLHRVARAHRQPDERRRSPLGRGVGRVSGQQAVRPSSRRRHRSSRSRPTRPWSWAWCSSRSSPPSSCSRSADRLPPSARSAAVRRRSSRRRVAVAAAIARPYRRRGGRRPGR